MNERQQQQPSILDNNNSSVCAVKLNKSATGQRGETGADGEPVLKQHAGKFPQGGNGKNFMRAILDLCNLFVIVAKSHNWHITQIKLTSVHSQEGLV